jgi:hypothetical protein
VELDSDMELTEALDLPILDVPVFEVPVFEGITALLLITKLIYSYLR